MTAPLKKNTCKRQTSEVCLDFMQTVQRNYTLNKRFIKYIDVNKKDVFGFTALYWAISHHNIYNLKLLIEHGATLQVTATMNALFYAIDCDNLEALRYFINRGIDKNITRVSNTGQSYTLLEHAIRIERKVIVEYLK